MKSLSKVLEGLLDVDFDIKDSDVMPSVRNWPRFMKRLQSINKPQPVEKDNQWTWKGTVEPLKILTKGIETDIGRPVGKNKAWDISTDREEIIIATFKGGDPYANVIYIGNSNGYIGFQSRSFRNGEKFDIETNVTKGGNLGLRIETMAGANWKFRVVPMLAYDIIKREFGLT